MCENSTPLLVIRGSSRPRAKPPMGGRSRPGGGSTGTSGAAFATFRRRQSDRTPSGGCGFEARLPYEERRFGVREISEETVDLLTAQFEIPLSDIVERYDDPAPHRGECRGMGKITRSVGRKHPPRLERPIIRDPQVDTTTIGACRTVVQGLAPVQGSEGGDRGAVECFAGRVSRRPVYAVERTGETVIGPPKIEPQNLGRVAEVFQARHMSGLMAHRSVTGLRNGSSATTASPAARPEVCAWLRAGARRVGGSAR